MKTKRTRVPSKELNRQGHKITGREAAEIYRKAKEYTYQALADAYDISYSMVFNIANGKSWTNVTRHIA